MPFTNTACVWMLFLLLPTAMASSEDTAADINEKLATKIEAAVECNTYVHFRKGKDAHCLFDPLIRNAILTAFHDRNTGIVKLGETILKDGDIKQLELGKSDFCVIYKKQKVVFVNLDTGQTGVIPLVKADKTAQ